MDPTEQLSDQVVVSCCQCPDFGEALARACAQAGAGGIVMCGRGVERGHALAAIVSAAGCPSEFLPVDLTRAEECAAVIAKAAEAFGRIDVLVVSVAPSASGAIWQTAPEALDQALFLDLRAPYLLMQGAAQVMHGQRTGGTIAHVLGAQADDGAGATTLRAMARGAFAHMVPAAADELRDAGIRVFGVDVGGPWQPQAGTEGGSPAGQPRSVARALTALLADPTAPASGTVVDLARLAASKIPMPLARLGA